jgi:arginine decarboxylase
MEMNIFVPTQVFFTKRVGRHKDYLQSLELALRDAGVEKCNLVHVSSILPPGCRRVSIPDRVRRLSAGNIVFVAMARNATNEPNRLIAASIDAAAPAEASHYGYLSEHHSCGETEEKSGDYAEYLAATMLSSTLGVEFNPVTAWDELEKIYRMREKLSERLTSLNLQRATREVNGLPLLPWRQGEAA